MNKDTLRQIAVIAATTVMIIMNILANALPLNGLNTGQISDQFKVYFVPAGYVFSIWGLIYIALIAFSVFQALPKQKTNPRLRSIGWLYVLSSLANIGWLFAWHYQQFPLTLAAMLPLLGLLIAIYLRLGIGRREVSTTENWATHKPFSIYLGWITVATIANITDVLDYLGWNGSPLTPEVWAVIMLVAATLITAAVLYTRRDVAYALVIVWAAIGIAVRQANVAIVPSAAMVVTLVVTALTIAAALLPNWQRSSRQAA